jgi:copper chaperone CopZ
MRKLLLLLAFVAPMVMFAADQTLTLKVSGNCGSCKKRIVKAAESVAGVEDANWDKKTKVFTATYDDAKTTPDAIKKAILAVGYDVEDAKGDDAAYKTLPDCCKYRDRTHE